MGKKNNSPKRNGFNMSKIYKYIRIGAVALPAAGIAISSVSNAEKLEQGVRAYFGWSMRHQQFRWNWLAQGWTPALAAIGVTYGLPKIAGMIRGFGK